MAKVVFSVTDRQLKELRSALDREKRFFQPSAEARTCAVLAGRRLMASRTADGYTFYRLTDSGAALVGLLDELDRLERVEALARPEGYS